LNDTVNIKLFASYCYVTILRDVFLPLSRKKMVLCCSVTSVERDASFTLFLHHQTTKSKSKIDAVFSLAPVSLRQFLRSDHTPTPCCQKACRAVASRNIYAVNLTEMAQWIVIHFWKSLYALCYVANYFK